MKIAIYSDLHNEFEPFDLPPWIEADVIVLAGDIDTGSKGIHWAARNFEQPVIYVPGNHEFYNQNVPSCFDRMAARAAEYDNVHLLMNGAVEIDGVRFVGTTLWTDFELYGDRSLAGVHAEIHLSDYHRIRVEPECRRLRSGDTIAWHKKASVWLQAELANKDNGQTVVVTHHLPSIRSSHPEYSDDLLTAAFASNLDAFVAECGAAFWLHGHSHHAVDYRLGETRVVCNPRGYAGYEKVPGFDPEKILELE